MGLLRKKGLFDGGRVLFLPVEVITPNPEQPRRRFEPAELEELAASIRELGILQPLSVRRQEGKWELIAGERRLRAAKLAGLETVPCLAVAADEKTSSLLALVENLQRQDLDYIEEAQGIDLLLRQWAMSQEQVAKLLGKSQSCVANKLRLLRHSGPVLNALRQEGLTERHARALLKLSEEPKKMQAIAVIARHNMSVARTEQYIESLLETENTQTHSANVGAFLSRLNQSLARIQSSGISAISERRETENQIVLTITIPK